MKAILSIGIFYLLTSPRLFPLYAQLPFAGFEVVRIIVYVAFFYPYLYLMLFMVKLHKHRTLSF